jgi:formylglycine-generating enzyme required for sulfatase activity
MKLLLLPVSIVFLLLLGSAGTTEKEFSYSKALTKSYVLVPSGTAIVNGDSVTVQSFYMYNKEVTNFNYLEFLYDLKSHGETELLKIAQVDSNRWNMLNSYNQAYVTYYHSHPAYKEYPVVNVSHEAALLYCKWLGEKYDEKFGTKGKFKFRLPERAEYIRAARGDSKASYAWKTNSLRNEKGQILCNFTQLGSEDIHRNTETGKYEIVIATREYWDNGFADILAPSESYWPNEFKIYNLNGNAAEMIAEKGIAMGGSWKNTGYDVRVESEQNYSEPNPWTGFRVVMTVVNK